MFTFTAKKNNYFALHIAASDLCIRKVNSCNNRAAIQYSGLLQIHGGILRRFDPCLVKYINVWLAALNIRVGQLRNLLPFLKVFLKMQIPSSIFTSGMRLQSANNQKCVFPSKRRIISHVFHLLNLQKSDYRSTILLPNGEV